MYKVDNAVIMAAGTSSRFAPLSYEMPKALFSVKGEILIERQIRQLQEAGIKDIYIVTGYQSEKFAYLEDKFNVKLRHNRYFLTRNNNASIYAVKDILANTYICSADNYFSENPFESEVESCYYAAVYAEGYTKEWCMDCDENGRICAVHIGGTNAWYMLGHAFWDNAFSQHFCDILEREFDLPETADCLWESIYIAHIDEFDMKIRKYADSVVYEFDTLDELREFDTSYVADTRSAILKKIAKEIGCCEMDMAAVNMFKDRSNMAAGFTFQVSDKRYRYTYETAQLKEESI